MHAVASFRVSTAKITRNLGDHSGHRQARVPTTTDFANIGAVFFWQIYHVLEMAVSTDRLGADSTFAAC